VVIPDTQKSWIGKAHLIGQTLTASYIRPGPNGDGFIYDPPTYVQPENNDDNAWMLLDGTPASCTNVGLYYNRRQKPVDLVISGPNYGRNSTALYIISSGTVGAAIEAALSGVKAISLSYAFEDRSIPPPYVKEATTRSVELIKFLWENWDDQAQLYSINVPMVASVASAEAVFTHILENTWGSVFHEVHDPTAADDDGKRQFTWGPDFDAADRTVAESFGNNDGRVIEQGCISVTPLRANYKDLPAIKGEITLE
jgi:5'/3'-nucleotidase SurE